jgi:hypothetical protein
MMKKQTPKIKRVVKKLDVHTNNDVKRYMGALAEHFGSQISAVAEQFGTLNKKLDIHTDMIGGIMEDVAIIKSDVEFLKAGMKNKVDYQDFEALVRRVSLVEAKLRR